jgi:hypothetical protein
VGVTHEVSHFEYKVALYICRSALRIQEKEFQKDKIILETVGCLGFEVEMISGMVWRQLFLSR